MPIFGSFFGTSKIFNIQNLWKIVFLTVDGGEKRFKGGERRVILFLTFLFLKVIIFSFNLKILSYVSGLMCFFLPPHYYTRKPF